VEWSTLYLNAISRSGSPAATRRPRAPDAWSVSVVARLNSQSLMFVHLTTPLYAGEPVLSTDHNYQIEDEQNHMLIRSG
jgi:hypothetical protein